MAGQEDSRSGRRVVGVCGGRASARGCRVCRSSARGKAPSLDELAPRGSLMLPVRLSSDRAEVVFRDGVPAILGAGEEQEGLLDVGGEMEEVHDLAHPGTGDLAPPGEGSVVSSLATPEEALEVDRKGHEASNPRDVARLRLGRRNAVALGFVACRVERPLEAAGQGHGIQRGCGLAHRSSPSLPGKGPLPPSRKTAESLPDGPS